MDEREAIAVDETTLETENEEVYVRAAVDVDTFEMPHVDVSPGRSGLNVLLFLNEVLKYYRDRPGQPAVRGDWYAWPLALLE